MSKDTTHQGPRLHQPDEAQEPPRRLTGEELRRLAAFIKRARRAVEAEMMREKEKAREGKADE